MDQPATVAVPFDRAGLTAAQAAAFELALQLSCSLNLKLRIPSRAVGGISTRE